MTKPTTYISIIPLRVMGGIWHHTFGEAGKRDLSSGVQRFGDAWGQLLACMPLRAVSHQNACVQMHIPMQFQCISLHCILAAY